VPRFLRRPKITPEEHHAKLVKETFDWAPAEPEAQSISGFF